MRVLLPYDGSPYADAAVDALGTCGLGSAPDICVLSVADVFDEVGAGSVRGFDGSSGMLRTHHQHTMDELDHARTTAEQGVRLVRHRVDGARVTALACCGSPAWEIVQKATELQSDLIVIGTHGRSALGRFMLGSVSTRVVEQAPCSVRIVRRPNTRAPGPLRILAGYDGSVDADAMLAQIEARSWPEGTQVQLVCAVDPVVLSAFGWLIPPLIKWADEVNADAASAVGRMLSATAARLQRAGLVVSSRMWQGRPSDMLAAAADDWQADVIFVGARGLRGIKRVLLGSVSFALATGARCSVEIVRTDPVAPPSTSRKVLVESRAD